MEDSLCDLPEGVRRAAVEIGGNICDRLVLDEKIMKVWSRLLKRKIIVDAVKNLPQKYRVRDQTGLDDANIAAAALFYIAFDELADVSQFESNQNQSAVKFYKKVSVLCRGMQYLKFLGDVDEHLGELHPRSNLEMQEALTKASLFFEKLAEAIERSDRGVRWDHRDDHRSTPEKTASKNRGKKSDGLANPRPSQAIGARLSAFIEAADKIYDRPRLIGPLADIATAFLAQRIGRTRIENCRQSLDRHRGPKLARQS